MVTGCALIVMPRSRSRSIESNAECGTRDAEPESFRQDRKSTRLNSSHVRISYAVFCLKKEEHTSELQSRPHLVCRLLLEKKRAHVGHPFTYGCLIRAYARQKNHQTIFRGNGSGKRRAE